MRSFLKPLFVLLVTLLFVETSQDFSIQKDLTADQRYSLSETTILQLEALKGPLRIDAFLTGELPGLYRDLWRELNILLNQIKWQYHLVALLISTGILLMSKEIQLVRIVYLLKIIIRLRSLIIYQKK